ncbi:MAG TPA: hypothetical protein VGN16_20795 [Acidobacteriaceae bacterium]|jgi:hypothetical protein
MKTTSRFLAVALLATLASPLLAMRPAAAKQHSTTPHDHTPRVHDRSLTVRAGR